MRGLKPTVMNAADNPAKDRWHFPAKVPATSCPVFVAAVLLVCAVGLSAQLRVRPVGELPGDAALQLTLRKLASAGTFMETDAHPDDEDNALLAQMSHGRGMRTVLVTATRGDGGQNEIGP